MAVDKLIDSAKETACRTAEANAIRIKSDSQQVLTYDFENNKGFADAIMAIPTGFTPIPTEFGQAVAIGDNTNSLTFTLPADITPTSFVLLARATFPAVYQTPVAIAVAFNGVEYNCQIWVGGVAYTQEGFTHTYVNGTMTISSTVAMFLTGVPYGLVYTYGAMPTLTLSLGTFTGVTSVTFGSIAKAPDRFVVMLLGDGTPMTNNVALVGFDGTDTFGYYYDTTKCTFSDATWEWTYNQNLGTVDILSASPTFAGMYIYVGISNSGGRVLDITENGSYDVRDAAIANVEVQGSGGVTPEQKVITQNGTYTAPEGKAYTPVIVNVSGGTDVYTVINRNTNVNLVDNNIGQTMARGIYAGTADMSAGDSLISGVIYLVYED